MSRHKLPPGNRVPRRIAKPTLGTWQYTVGSWCPTPDGSGPATEVHFVVQFDDPEVADMALRLKSARAVDELVALLRRHRADVWPGAAEAYPD